MGEENKAHIENKKVIKLDGRFSEGSVVGYEDICAHAYSAHRSLCKGALDNETFNMTCINKKASRECRENMIRIAVSYDCVSETMGGQR